MRPWSTRSPLPRAANEAIFALHSRENAGSAAALKGIVTRATVHLKKIAVKSQEVGKQISRNIVMQQNPAAAQQEIRFCSQRWSASLPVRQL